MAQTVTDWELIIVDDGSTDSTAEIIADYRRRDGRIRVLSHGTNKGLAVARNTALAEARGELIAFIDCDDVWHPEKFTRQVATMEHHQADISYTGYERCHVGKQRGSIVSVSEQVSYGTMLGRNKIAICTAMVRRSTCGADRMPQVERGADHAYWLALLRDGSRTAVGVTQSLAQYRLHGKSLSANKLLSALWTWKRFREEEGLGWRSIYYFSVYVFDSLKFRLRGR